MGRVCLHGMSASDLNYSAFETTFDKVLDKHAPVKKKYVRANDKPFMTRALRKAVMLRSRLRSRYNKNQTVENWNNFRKLNNEIPVLSYFEGKKKLLQQPRHLTCH